MLLVPVKKMQPFNSFHAIGVQSPAVVYVALCVCVLVELGFRTRHASIKPSRNAVLLDDAAA
jgi:hypothetical protein